MADITIEVEGLEELGKALKDYGKEWGAVAKKALGPGLSVLEAEGKIRASGRPGPRVQTNVLRSSIGGAPPEGIREIIQTGSEIVGKMGSNVEYASFVEEGTSKMPPYPYLKPALEAKRDEVVKLFEKGIADALKRLFP